MRKMLLLFLFFTVIFCANSVFAATSAYSQDTKWVFVNTKTPWALSWYYAPEFTIINDQKLLDTWIKEEYTGENTDDYITGEYTVTHYYINAAGNKYLKTEWSVYEKDGNLRLHRDDPKAIWRDIRPGSGFEQCVWAAIQYAHL